MGYLFDNQVTPEELDAIAHEITDHLMDMIIKNMHVKIKGELEAQLNRDIKNWENININYKLEWNRGFVDGCLSKVRRTGEFPIPKKFKMISDFWGLRGVTMKRAAK
jgi:hypothetical protein